MHTELQFRTTFQSYIFLLATLFCLNSYARPIVANACFEAESACSKPFVVEDPSYSFKRGPSKMDIKGAEQSRDRITMLFGICESKMSDCANLCAYFKQANRAQYLTCENQKNAAYDDFIGMREKTERAAQIVQGFTNLFKEKQFREEILIVPEMNSVIYQKGNFKAGILTTNVPSVDNPRKKGGMFGFQWNFNTALGRKPAGVD